MKNRPASVWNLCLTEEAFKISEERMVCSIKGARTTDHPPRKKIKLGPYMPPYTKKTLYDFIVLQIGSHQVPRTKLRKAQC